MNGYDIDGVISIGLHPSSDEDVIITGRSIEEKDETGVLLNKKGLSNNEIFYQNIPFIDKTRELSGRHKARVINFLYDYKTPVDKFFEDDPIQADLIEMLCGHTGVKVVRIVHDLTEKENVRHLVDEY